MSMDGRLDRDGLAWLKTYFDTIGSHLSTQGRALFATYAMGIFGDGERKSVQPMAARFACDPSSTQRKHDRLLYFLRVMPWPDTDVRREAAKMGVDAMQSRGPISSWILDDTGFLKQGRHSVGVQRQYTGSAGKIANSAGSARRARPLRPTPRRSTERRSDGYAGATEPERGSSRSFTSRALRSTTARMTSPTCDRNG